MSNPSHISLSLLNSLIREVVEGNFMEDVWLVAEIAEVKPAASGHCYLELVEKKNDKIVARMKANIWSFQYQKIATEFYSTTGKHLEKGMEILLLAGVSFHELYGISLVVKNVNPNFTLGNLERLRKETLDRLKREGLMEKNKQLELELLPKRIAVLSSESAAGYEDFLQQITKNSKGFCFEITLFPCVMQGDKTEASLLEALSKIQSKIGSFDVVAILRGGGASLDLAAFDSYQVAKSIALFPLPVVSGIGHERDVSVVDHVVHTRLKTPTAVAEFFIQQFDDFEQYVNGLQDALVYLVRDRLAKEKNKEQKITSALALGTHVYIKTKDEVLSSLQQNLKSSVKMLFVLKKQYLQQKGVKLIQVPKFAIFQQQQNLKYLQTQVQNGAKKYLDNHAKELKNWEQTLRLLNPENVLKRGYALLENEQGKIIKSTKQTSVGETVNIKLKDGKVKAKIEKS